MFDYAAEYRTNSQKVVADALSRLSMLSKHESVTDNIHDQLVWVIRTYNMTLSAIQKHAKSGDTLSVIYD